MLESFHPPNGLPYPLPFAIGASRKADRFLISADGELDMLGRPELERVLREAEDSDVDQIIVDIEALTFIDSAGLTALLEASQRSSVTGNRLRVTRGQGQVARVLHLTELHRAMPLVSSIQLS
jgi:anti-sigma B factor antagonist